MGEKEVTTFDELFDFVQSLSWKKYLQTDNISIKAISKTSQLSSERTIQSIVHKAILQSYSPSQDDHFSEEIMVYLEHNHAKVMLNTSGVSLHQRGYRTQAGIAPLKENIAAAIVLLAGWKFKTPLIDPCCGSGTIPIEAAMIAKNIAPGLQRTFAFQYFKN